MAELYFAFKRAAISGMTVREQLQKCADQLAGAGLCFGHGTDNAVDEAAWLVQSALGLSPLELEHGLDNPLDLECEQRIREILNARIRTRQPLAYLLGEAWFCGLRFEVNADVLVPRSPFAELIEHEFQPWLNADEVGTVLDLCTGSGCIAIALALHMPWMRVDASDVSGAALAVARRNRSLHGLDKQLELIESDLFAELAGKQYDLIVSNPPYVAAGRFAELPEEYRAEPELGLVSPGAGLHMPLKILTSAPDYLAPCGKLFCEVGESAGALQQLLPDVPFTWLEFEHGGEGVFTIDRAELVRHAVQFEEALERVRDVL